MPDFLPSTDEGLLGFATPYSGKITLTPTAYNLTAAIATVLSGKLGVYSSALAASTDPATRGPSKIAAKDIAKADLAAYIRQTAKQVRGSISVTNQQLIDLGLTPRSNQRPPIPAPASAPDIDILSVSGSTVKIRLHDPATPTRRGKPAGVDSAAVFSFVGATPPSDEADWTFEGNITKTTLDVAFPAGTAPGAKVWITAYWLNPRAERGPAATAVTCNIPGGSAMAA